MTATFQSLRDTRLPKAEKAIGLLKNLVRYSHDEQEAKDVVNEINDAADDLDAVFAEKWGWGDGPETTTVRTGTPPAGRVLLGEGNVPAPSRSVERRVIPTGTADGGASFEAEVRWALDALKRGDRKLAENRLARILRGETDDGTD